MTLFIGLTGSIGMGKSTTAQMFRDAGVPVHDADATVHRLYRSEAVGPIEAAFPGTTGPDGVDRAELGAAVIGRPDAMKRLEAIVHPLVREAENEFRAEVADKPLAVLDIPLLFETGGADRVDAIVVVTAPADVQRARVLARPDMSPDKFAAILAKQTPDAEKRARADFVIDTSRGMKTARADVAAIIQTLSEKT